METYLCSVKHMVDRKNVGVYFWQYLYIWTPNQFD